MEEDTHTHKRKNLSCSWTGKINITRLPILPKTIYRFNGILVKVPRTSFSDLAKKKIPKCKTRYKIPKHQNSLVLAQTQTRRSIVC